MRRPLISAASAMFALLTAVSIAHAQQQVEGTVVSTKMTAYDTIKIQKGTVIKHGDGHLFLPGTKGRLVAITYVEDKGEKVAKSVEVKAAKP